MRSFFVLCVLAAVFLALIAAAVEPAAGPAPAPAPVPPAAPEKPAPPAPPVAPAGPASTFNPMAALTTIVMNLLQLIGEAATKIWPIVKENVLPLVLKALAWAKDNALPLIVGMVTMKVITTYIH